MNEEKKRLFERTFRGLTPSARRWYEKVNPKDSQQAISSPYNFATMAYFCGGDELHIEYIRKGQLSLNLLCAVNDGGSFVIMTLLPGQWEEHKEELERLKFKPNKKIFNTSTGNTVFFVTFKIPKAWKKKEQEDDWG